MAGTCSEKCPRIKALNEANIRPVIPVPTMIDYYFSHGLYEGSLQALEAVCKEAESCPGPVEKVTYVSKGILHRKIVPEIVWTCGLDQRSSTDTL